VVELFAGAQIVPTRASTPKRHPSPFAWIAGALSAALVGSLYYVWFTAPGSPSDGFFLGVEGAFQANGYPVKIVVRLIVVIAALVVGALVVRAVIDLAPWSVRPASDLLLDRLLVGATALNLVFVFVALSFPARPMVRFPAASSCPAAYFGLAAAALALASSVLATRLE
jgi:hypothetical protein